MKGLSSEDEEALTKKIVLAIDAQIRHRRRLHESNQFCPDWPHPATWLNQQRWLDELSSVETNTTKNTRTCECGKDATIIRGRNNYCARCFVNKFTPNKKVIYERLKESGLAKRKDETREQYNQRCKTWCLQHGYERAPETEGTGTGGF